MMDIERLIHWLDLNDWFFLTATQDCDIWEKGKFEILIYYKELEDSTKVADFLIIREKGTCDEFFRSSISALTFRDILKAQEENV